MEEEKITTQKLELDSKAKSLSKFISVISKVGVGLLGFSIFCLLICIVVLPFASKNIKAGDNYIDFFGEVVSYEVHDDLLTFKYNDEDFSISYNEGFQEILDLINNDSIKKLVLYVELAIFFAIGSIIILIITLLKTSRLFNNFSKKDSPFIDENINYLNNIVKLLITSIIYSVVVNIILNIVLDTNSGINISVPSVMLILVVIIVKEIFIYGQKLENK